MLPLASELHSLLTNRLSVALSIHVVEIWFDAHALQHKHPVEVTRCPGIDI